MEKTAKIGYLIITIIALVFGVAISYAQHTLEIEGYKQIAFDSGSNIISHRVGKGDSLTSLAYRYRTTVNDIKQANKLKRDNIYFGEILKVPYNTRGYKGENSYIRYSVATGDSLSKIAVKYKTDVKSIKKANNLKNNSIKVGQNIKIPYGIRIDERKIHSEIAERDVAENVEINKSDNNIRQKYVDFLDNNKNIYNDSKVLAKSDLKTKKYIKDESYNIINKKDIESKTVTKSKKINKEPIISNESEKNTIGKLEKQLDINNENGLNNSTKQVNKADESKELIIIGGNKSRKENNKNSGLEKQKELNPRSYMRYRVKNGDTLSSLAQGYEISVNELKSINRLDKNNIYIGQSLKVPNVDKNTDLDNKKHLITKNSVKTSRIKENEAEISIPDKNVDKNESKLSKVDVTDKDKVEKADIGNTQKTEDIGVDDKKPRKANTSDVIKYTVKRGNSLSIIAEKYNVLTKELLDFNDLKTNQINIGQKLLIPDTGFIRYRVKSGDNLSTIAVKYGSSTKELKEINELKNNQIRIGQNIKIPKQIHKDSKEKLIVAKSNPIVNKEHKPEKQSDVKINPAETDTKSINESKEDIGLSKANQIKQAPLSVESIQIDKSVSSESELVNNKKIVDSTKVKTEIAQVVHDDKLARNSNARNEETNLKPKDNKIEVIKTADVNTNLDKENNIKSEKAENSDLVVKKELQRVTSNTKPKAESDKSHVNDSIIKYKVESGDNLSTLAVNYDTTVKELISLNKLKGKQINIGQTLKIPNNNINNNLQEDISESVILTNNQTETDSKVESEIAVTGSKSELNDSMNQRIVENSDKKMKENEVQKKQGSISNKDKDPTLAQLDSDNPSSQVLENEDNKIGKMEEVAQNTNDIIEDNLDKADVEEIAEKNEQIVKNHNLDFKPEGDLELKNKVQLAELLTIEENDISNYRDRYQTLINEQDILAKNGHGNRHNVFAQRTETNTPKKTTKVDIGEEIINFPGEIDLRDLVQTMSEITNESFIVDDKLKPKKVTIITPKGGFSKKNAIRLFEAILDLNGFTIFKKGIINVVTETRNIKQQELEVIKGRAFGDPSDRYVTQIVPLKNISAQDVANTLKPLISREGDIVVYAPLNTLIIVEAKSNLNKILTILENVDKEKDVIFVKIYNSEAADIAAILNEIFGGTTVSPVTGTAGEGRASDRRKRRRTGAARRTGTGGQRDIAGFKIITDERTNSLIIIAFPEDIPKIKTVIERLDVKIDEPEHGIYVIRLKNGSAEQIVTVINSLISGGLPASRITRGFGVRSGEASLGEIPRQRQEERRAATAGAGSAASITGLQLEDVRITSDIATNSIIVIGSRRQYQAILSVVDELDIRRKQVFVEAAILEVALDQLKALGANFSIGFSFNDDNLGFGGTNLPGVPSLLGAAADTEGAVSLLGSLSGLFLGVVGEEVDVDGSGPIPPIPSFTALFQALTSITDVNILSTPSIITTDNEEAEIVIADVIPFPTGTTVGDSGVTVQTIDREPVGIRLAITPQIGDGDYLRLEIQIEVSNVRPSPPDLNTEDFGITTSTRSASTSVVLKNGQTIVIGGLVQDRVSVSENKVPGLGNIPILGNLFKFKATESTKINLMILLTPKIVEDERDMKLILEDRQKRNMILQQRHIDEEKFLPQ